jgi:hypothetical protein
MQEPAVSPHVHRGGMQEAWDLAEDASMLAGFPFLDRHSSWQNEDMNASYVAKVLGSLLTTYPDKKRYEGAPLHPRGPTLLLS